MKNIENIRLSAIILDNDRKEGGQGDIKKLAQSIRQIGLIHPISVRKSKDGTFTYEIIAGRRRVLAYQHLGFIEIAAFVYEAVIDGNQMALAENVNRLTLHPLDEGKQFSVLLKKGKKIEELTRLYDRSPAHIYQRVKLCSLIGPLKDAFRKGSVSISQAARIASLPEETQQGLYEHCRRELSYGQFYDEKMSTYVSTSLKHPLWFCSRQCGTCKKERDTATQPFFLNI